LRAPGVLRFMDTGLRQDILYAVRNFRRNPGLVAAVVISVALGIAANTTVFSIVDAMLLGQLPVHEPSRLMSFNDGNSLSWPNYADYRDQTRSVFEGVTAYFALVPASVGGRGEPERIWGQLTVGNFFSTVGVPMAAGRGFNPAEDAAPGRSPVVVLTYGLWQRRFAGDPTLLGRDILLNGQRYTVVGITAKGFHGIDRGLMPEFWVPLSMGPEIIPDMKTEQIKTKRDSQWLCVVARLRPGVSRATALAAVNVVNKRIHDTWKKNERFEPVRLTEAGGLLGGEEMGAAALLTVLMVVTGMLLIIACVNVAGLLLSRATARQREIGIRLSIGATRGRLIRQLLTESMLLSGLGAVAGFALASAATRGIGGFRLPIPIPIAFEFRMNLRVMAFTAALAIVTGILFGLAPALRATRPDLVSWLKGNTGGLGRMRQFGLRNSLVLIQVALSLVLLIGAGLFLRSLQNASSIDLGIRTNGVVAMAFEPRLHHYSADRTRQFMDQLRQRVSTQPGVESVSFVNILPLSIGGESTDFHATGADQKNQTMGDVYTVGEQYFQTIGTPLLRGRAFDRGRDGNIPSVVINEEMAQKAFPGRDPIGQVLEMDEDGKQDLRVIGIVRNSKSRTLGEKTAACAYLFLDSRTQDDAISFFGVSILVRSHGDPWTLARAVKSDIRALDPNMPVSNIETLSQHVDKSLLLPRLCALLLGIFGTVGIVLAAVGLFGVMSFAARARTREIGIRMALGALPRGVLGLVARQGFVVAGVGLIIGLALALALSRFTASMLYGISALDPVTFVAVPLLLLAIAVIAVLIPARRASRIDPLEALRYE
jgi:predicted permease